MQKAALGTALFAVAGLLIGLYGTVDRTMPDWLFWLSRTVLVGTLVVGLLIAAYLWAIVPVWQFHKSRRYQWPAVNKANPPLYKKLLDMEDADRRELEKCLLVASHQYVFVDMENVTPYLQLYITVRNESVFTLEVSPITGQVSLGEPFDEPVEDENKGWRKVQRRQPYQISLHQQLGAERIPEVRTLAESGRIELGLAKLTFKVKIDEADAAERELGFMQWIDETTTFEKMSS